MSDKTSLHILCVYRSPNSISENNKLLNQLILNTSLIGRKLLILWDFNFPAINWNSLLTPHLSNRCASEFLAATQEAFLFQYVQSPTHTRRNQKPTLIDLIFSQDYQTITNMTTSATLGQVIIKFWGFITQKIITRKMKGHVTYTIVLTMTVWNISYKELIGMKCFIIVALLNIGENLK